MKTRMMSILAVAGILSAAIGVAAKEAKSDGPDNTPKVARRTRARTQTKAKKFKNYLLEKYPEEMKEIEGEQKQLQEKRRTLFKKAMEEISDTDREKLGIDSRREAAAKHRAAAYAREKYPEELKGIKELWKSNKKEASEKMRDLLDKAAKEMPADWKPEKGVQKRWRKNKK